MRFWTNSGSEYETDGQRIRRVHGLTEATARVGDGWREFISVCAVEGSCAVIIWPDSVPHAEGTVPTTITSSVIRVEA